jgi:[ribosomal protein S5]-alanine N-acetyltransferase
MKILETDRLTLSELTIPNGPFILELVNSPGWLQFIGDRQIKNIADAENYIVNGPMASYTRYGHGLYLVTLKETTASIGICGIIKRDTLETEDIGFALLPQYAGKGYALEAAAATLEYAQEKLGLKKIVAITLEANHRSINLLTKLGLLFERKITMPPKEEELMLFTTA